MSFRIYTYLLYFVSLVRNLFNILIMVMKEILNIFQKFISHKSTAEGIVALMQFIN